jgi:hypothetical protein
MIMDKWYKNCYRRNLVDMHIEDWSEEFLSKFSIEDYFDNLVIAKVQSPMIFLQSHIGYCYWPTKCGHMHNSLRGREDMVKRLIEKCRAHGMPVVGYYSLIYNNWAAINHPDWKTVKAENISGVETSARYHFCCPNNPGYREFVFKQIEEISRYFKLDGMFYDMTFWPEVCRCEHCKKRWEKEAGGIIPNEDWDKDRWNLFIKKRQEWIGEFAGIITEKTKSFMPGITVEHNYAGVVAFDWLAGSTELVNEASDYTGGDLYGDLYNHSFTCKYYMDITKNKPFEYMTCRVNNRLYQHTVSKSERQLALEVMLTTLHGGASLIIDAIDPAGTLDRRVYDRIGKVFAKVEMLEPYLSGLELIADAGVFFDTTAKHARPGQKYSNRDCAVNTVKTLIKNNISVGVVSNGCLSKLKNYKIVFASDVGNMDTGTVEKLIDYTQNGGTLYISGEGNERIRNILLGAELLKMSEENVTYAAPFQEYERIFAGFNREYPLSAEYRQPLLKLDGTSEIWATIALPYTVPNGINFASIHSNPPGKYTEYPAFIKRQFGSGTVLWSGFPIENDVRENYTDIIKNICDNAIPKSARKINYEAPARAEVVVMRGKNSIIVGIADLIGDIDNSELPGFAISILSDYAAIKTTNLLTGREVPFKFAGNRIEFICESFINYNLYKIDLSISPHNAD